MWLKYTLKSSDCQGIIDPNFILTYNNNVNIKLIVEKFRKINSELYAKAKDPLRCHGVDHHDRVCQNALMLAGKISPKNLDYEVLIAACYLHDITAYEASMDSASHHAASKVMAEEILNKIDFPQEKIPKVLAAIAGHGSDPKYRQKNEAMETTLLRDADKMDVFGPIGVARMIMARAKRADNLREILTKFYGDDIKRKWQSITTKEAKELTRENYRYSKDFFSMLKKLLKD